jgi:hypothetical protein
LVINKREKRERVVMLFTTRIRVTLQWYIGLIYRQT